MLTRLRSGPPSSLRRPRSSSRYPHCFLCCWGIKISYSPDPDLPGSLAQNLYGRMHAVKGEADLHTGWCFRHIAGTLRSSHNDYLKGGLDSKQAFPFSSHCVKSAVCMQCSPEKSHSDSLCMRSAISRLTALHDSAVVLRACRGITVLQALRAIRLPACSSLRRSFASAVSHTSVDVQDPRFKPTACPAADQSLPWLQTSDKRWGHPTHRRI